MEQLLNRQLQIHRTMKITFQNVTPTPLKESQFSDESIWNSQFELEEGSRILLNATSGKGKTTFTHLLAGVRLDYSGKILYNREDISLFTLEKWTEIRRTKMAFVFQDLQLFPSLTVAENLALKNNLTTHKSTEQLQEETQLLGIEHKWNQRVSELSMGQQQRVAIIRALAQPFEWIILDEPFSHLDHENAQIAYALVEKNCNEQNAGFILTTLNETSEVRFNKEINL